MVRWLGVRISACMSVEFVTESYSRDSPADSRMSVMKRSSSSRSVSLGALMISLWKVSVMFYLISIRYIGAYWLSRLLSSAVAKSKLSFNMLQAGQS